MKALGLESGTVRVVPYDRRWPTLFEAEATGLREALGSSILAIHHVGSTAVPGLSAKPILDILVAIEDFERGRELAPSIESLGYEYRPDEDVPDRHYFRRRTQKIRTHHLSLAEPRSKHHVDTIAFRDALRADPQIAAAYVALKLALAQRFPRDRMAYVEGKSDFIEKVLANARAG